MSYRTGYKIADFFDYVVPPLEGFWYQDGVDSSCSERKSMFRWISVIRLPKFIAKNDLLWAVETAKIKMIEGHYSSYQ